MAKFKCLGTDRTNKTEFVKKLGSIEIMKYLLSLIAESFSSSWYPNV